MGHKHCLELLECWCILLYIVCADTHNRIFFFNLKVARSSAYRQQPETYGCVIIIAVLFLPFGLFQDRKRQAELAKLQMTSQKQQSVLKRKVEEVQCDFLDHGV